MANFADTAFESVGKLAKILSRVTQYLVLLSIIDIIKDTYFLNNV